MKTPLEVLQETYGEADAEVIAFAHVHHHPVREIGPKLLIGLASLKGRENVPGHSVLGGTGCAPLSQGFPGHTSSTLRSYCGRR